MSDIYLTLADGLEKLAIGYRALASENINEIVKYKHIAGELKLNNNISVQDISAVLAEKSNEGKSDKIKALLMKYNAEKLVKVRPVDYAVIFEEAKKL
ncbi:MULTISPECIES: hypothetical protein [Clostridium]|uniref:Uncharacterized protein n=1 Tax=Clostridium frigoriphilum TaxID=443253 RepID=A0ABU7USR1_9CLOT|nr:hypothetical protein [Clostridium sp. DSM 17811]MBU3100694.1 hypothetical protein [Clostridium sp. DSM 17811]